eukprot:1082080-Prymnesium_polylepis.2
MPLLSLLCFSVAALAAFNPFSEDSIARAWHHELHPDNVALRSSVARHDFDSSPTAPFLAFSAGFTDDAVLQRGPGAAAVYGIAPHGVEVTVTLSDDLGISAPSTISATKVDMGGTADPLCQARCVCESR